MYVYIYMYIYMCVFSADTPAEQHKDDSNWADAAVKPAGGGARGGNDRPDRPARDARGMLILRNGICMFISRNGICLFLPCACGG